MPFKASCPHCQAVINAPDGSSGKTAKCPKCGERFVVGESTDVEHSEVPPLQGTPPPVPKFNFRSGVPEGQKEDIVTRMEKKGVLGTSYADDIPRRYVGLRVISIILYLMAGFSAVGMVVAIFVFLINDPSMPAAIASIPFLVMWFTYTIASAAFAELLDAAVSVEHSGRWLVHNAKQNDES